MIHIITGVPGAGKTLRAIHHILEHQKKGRLIYTNIDGIKIKGVQPAPDDWTKTPEGSLVVYDEAQKIFPPDGKTGRSNRLDIAAMEEHRHTGHDLILITQHPNLIHSHVRRLTGKHEHLNRAFGWNKAQIYLKDQIMRPESRTDLNAAEKTFWNHDPKLFDHYKSSSLHVEHKRVPKPIIFAGITVALGLAVVAYFWTTLSFFGNEPSNDHASVLSSEPSSDMLEVKSSSTSQKNVYTGVEPPKIAMAGCISTKHYCRCYTHEYEPIFMSQAACRNQMEMPIPRNLDVEDSRGADEGAPREPQQTPPLPSSGFTTFNGEVT